MSTIAIACPSCRSGNTVEIRDLLQRPRCTRCSAQLGPSAPIELTRDSLSAVLEESPLPVLLMVHSQWNPQSTMAQPVVVQVAQRHSGRLLCARISADMFPDVSKRHGVTTLPALILFRGGSEKRRLTGAHSVAEIDKLVTG